MRRLARAAFGVPALLRGGAAMPRPSSPSVAPLASATSPAGTPGGSMAALPAMQRIAEISRAACDRAAANSTPARAFLLAPPPPRLTLEEISEITACVRRVSALDLGLPRSLFAGPNRRIAFVNVAENSTVVMAVFVLPPGTRIPLHDHPDMFVFSKVLWGDLKVQSYDVVPGTDGSTKMGVRQADEVSPADTVRVLDPVRGNVHCFSSDTWTAVFDVVIPPYNTGADRGCTYYEPAIPGGGAIGDHVSLEAVKIPADFLMYEIEYSGVEVQI